MAAFTITASASKFTADHTAFVCGFDLSNASVPAAFWTDVNASGGNIRVRDGSLTRVPVDPVQFDKTNERGWIWFRADVLTGSDNEFTVDTNGDGSASFDMDDVWQDYDAVIMLGSGDVTNRVDGSEFTAQGAVTGFAEDTALRHDFAVGDAHQGIAFDGSHYYVFTDNEIRKYVANADKSFGSLVATNSDPEGDLNTDKAAAVTHTGDGCEHNGSIWVGFTDQSSESWVGEFDASDLSYVDAFEITAQQPESASSVAFNPDDGLLYVGDFAGGDAIYGYDPVDGSFDATITFSTGFGVDTVQGITFRDGYLYVSVDPRVHQVELDGTVLGEVAEEAQLGTSEGLDFNDDGLIWVWSQTASGDRITFWPEARDLDLCGGGGFRMLPTGTHRMTESVGVDAGRTTWTAGISYAPADNTQDAQWAFAPAGTANTHRIAPAIDDGTHLAVWDNNNSWLDVSPPFDPPLEPTMGRMHVVYVDTTERRIYSNGALGNTDSTITAKGGMGGAEAFFVVGDGVEGGSNSKWAGRIGFAYLIAVDLGDEWIADEYSLLDDNAAFWTVGEASQVPTVFINAVHDDSVDASTSAFVPTGGGSHTHTQWQIRVQGGATVYDPGDDATNLTSITGAGASVPLTADTVYEIRARWKEDNTTYSDWSAWVPFTTSGGVVGVPIPKDFRVIVYQFGEDVGGDIEFALQDPHLVTPLEIGGQAARVLDGVSESVPYTVRFHDPDDEFSALLFDANGRPAVLGRVVEVRLIENGTALTIDVRRLGALRLLAPPAVEMELIDERQFDRVVLFGHNPTIKALNPGPAGFGSAWATIPDPGGTGGEVVGSSGDFRQIDEDASSIFLTHGPQKAAIERDVIDSPSASNTTGNFKTLIARIGGITRPITSFGALSAATADDVLDLDNWGVADLTPPPFWVYWPGGPASGSAGEVELEFTQSGESGHLPGVPTTAEMPFLIEEDDIRDLLTNIATPGGLYAPSGTTPLRFLLPSTAELPADRLPAPISIAVPAPIRRADMLIQVARIAGLVLWTDSQGRIVPRPWAVPPIDDFTQMDLDALFKFDASSATTVPTYEVQISRAFNVWKAQGAGIFPRSVSLADTPFIGVQLEDDEVEFEDTASSPIGPNRVEFTASFPGYIVSDGLVSGSPLSVGETFVGQTLGGQAQGRITGHTVSDAPLPGDLVLLDHDDLKSLNPDTGARSGQQLARVVDRRRTYTEAEVYFDYRLIYGGEA